MLHKHEIHTHTGTIITNIFSSWQFPCVYSVCTLFHTFLHKKILQFYLFFLPFQFGNKQLTKSVFMVKGKLKLNEMVKSLSLKSVSLPCKEATTRKRKRTNHYTKYGICVKWHGYIWMIMIAKVSPMETCRFSTLHSLYNTQYDYFDHFQSWKFQCAKWTWSSSSSSSHISVYHDHVKHIYLSVCIFARRSR